ncbi:MAG: class I adenylate-forming enzyme family protein [Alphaproteobacteria bacterium]|nr:class I adenylate-forming enzyme family protein [Alphaproteobacteria bacterium]
MSAAGRPRYGDLVHDRAARTPGAPALQDREGTYDWAGAAAGVDDAARRLLAIGVRPGDHVALWLGNSADWVLIAFAVFRIGGVLVPLNTRFRARDMAYVLAQSDSSFLIAESRSGPIDYMALIREVVRLPRAAEPVADPGFPALRHVVLTDAALPGTIAWDDIDPANADRTAIEARAAAVDPDAPAFIMYTSGTTGTPKGVVHSHGLVRNVEERAFRMRMTSSDIILDYLPLFHAFAFSEAMLMSAVTGARHIVTRSFEPGHCLDLIERHRVTVIHGFEAHMKGLAEAQEARPRDLSSLRTGIFAAGMLSATPVVRRGARALAPIVNLSGFGMTETWIGVALCSLDDDETRRCESSGHPALGYEVRIVDPERGTPCEPGRPGELQVRGRSMMLGYYRKPEETAASFVGGGWFRTGDTAVWLDDGYIRFLGRHRDMLKVGGENVDPMETEGLLLEDERVHQVAVVGCPDQELGEVPVAYVQPEPGCRLEAGDVIGICRGVIASFKIPRHVVFVDGFPMTESGKIRKEELRSDARRLEGTVP